MESSTFAQVLSAESDCCLQKRGANLDNYLDIDMILTYFFIMFSNSITNSLIKRFFHNLRSIDNTNMKLSLNHLLLLMSLLLSTAAISQTSINVDPLNPTGLVGNDFNHGIFYVPKTAEAQQDFQSNGIYYNSIRLHIIESALNNTSNLNECLAFLDLGQTQLQEIAARCNKVIFIFEKMPAWLSSSSDGSPAQTPGWFVLNTKPPSDYNAWNATVSAITSQLVNDYGITNAYFEIWNEPDLGSWTATENEYFELFKNTYDAIKAVDNSLPVGGPATNFWANHINWQAPYGYLNSTIADSSLLGGLIDSSVAWNKPLDFVSWHNFHIIHTIQDNIQNYLNQKCTNLGIGIPEMIISEWNTPSTLRETELQHSFFIKNQMTLVQTNISANVIAAWQDFESSPQEFHSDYGLLSYGSIHKPVYKALLLSDRLKGEYIPTYALAPYDMIATVSNDTVQFLITNYASDPFVEALNHTLFTGGFTLNQLDSAGFVDINNNSIGYLDSIYQQLLPFTPVTPLETAIYQTIGIYTYYNDLQSTPRTFNFNFSILGMGLYIESADYFTIDAEKNNSIFEYNSLISQGFNQTSAINAVTADQSLEYTHIFDPGANAVSTTLQPNAVQLIEVKIPTILSLNEPENSANILVYPNPTKDVVTVTTDQASIGCYMITNLQGRLIKEQKTHASVEHISVDRMEPGIYFLHLKDHKVVKQFVKM